MSWTDGSASCRVTSQLLQLYQQLVVSKTITSFYLAKTVAVRSEQWARFFIFAHRSFSPFTSEIYSPEYEETRFLGRWARPYILKLILIYTIAYLSGRRFQSYRHLLRGPGGVHVGHALPCHEDMHGKELRGLLKNFRAICRDVK